MSINGVRQLKGVLLRYCDKGGSSRGVRAFLESPILAKFAKENPSLEIRVQKKRNLHPLVVGQYVHGARHEIGVKNKAEHEVLDVLFQLRNRSGFPASHRPQPITKVGSIQGKWTPTMNFPEINFRNEA